MDFSGRCLELPSPEPFRRRLRIYPVFLPFSGCRTRCVFCAQDVQTGRQVHSPQSGGTSPVIRALRQAGRDLENLAAQADSGLELAFYGGTFTALPEDDLAACLAFAAHWRERGLVDSVRCSTRPDAVLQGEPARLKAAGITLVELGVQSFSDAALTASSRGYNGQIARNACEAVLKAGLDLGVQLMPGMPGLALAEAQEDAALAAELLPACVRLYPCLVLRGTPLATMWQEGHFIPWNMEETADFLAEACLGFWERGIAVIRMGLAEQPGLLDHVLAGPRHSSLGSLVRGRATMRYISKQLAAAGFAPGRTLSLCAPRSAQGYFWGHKGEMEPAYAALGITRPRVTWHDKPVFIIQHP